ncbi:MAG: rod shape-determining protein RodA [Acidobacteria bacterium]|nr:rod shape-determining protein RodA [Acidobacteriota bacterium]
MFREPITFSFKNQDLMGIVLVLILIAIGGIAVNSATEGTKLESYAFREWIYIGVSLVAFAAALYIPYTVWIEYGYILYGIIIFTLIFMPLIGKSVSGSKSWLGFGIFNFQPSEIAKVFTILALCSFIRDEDTNRFTLREFSILIALIFIPFILTLLQPDFGTAVTFLSLVPAVLIFSDLKLKEILKIGAIGFAVFAILFGLAWVSFFKPYQKERVLTFLNPSRDPQKSGYQVNQAKIAVGSGKLYGKGLHSGTQNRLNFLPAPHTDFIFAVIGEELGFVGSSFVILLFLFLLHKFLVIAENAKTKEGSFLCLAVFSLLFLHFFVNIGMVLGLFPIMGIPLPFLSFGGSFLVTSALLSGLALNVGSYQY